MHIHHLINCFVLLFLNVSTEHSYFLVELNQNKSNIHKDSSENILLLKLTLQFNKKWIAFCADSFFRGSVSRKCFENADASEK